jgi:DNA-directed RNA polymerase subunit RPC12/RpoP
MANEKRLIDANAFIATLEEIAKEDENNYFHLDEITQEVFDAPTVEVVHGRWIGTHDGWYYSYSCSECGAEALTKEGTMHDQVCSNYCPNCGAKMDGDGNG